MLYPSSDPAFYSAQHAYAARAFSQHKRYQVSEITAHRVGLGSPCRQEVEAFIAMVFSQAYGASIDAFMPELVALRDQSGVLMAAFGMRLADAGPLFLERYIDEPIECLMSRTLGREIPRAEITCIGNLAVANPRNAGVLIAHVIQHSLETGVQWAVATAHHSLQNGLIKGGRDVYPLAVAHPARLSEQEFSKWGRYYKQLPQIVAIRGVALPL